MVSFRLFLLATSLFISQVFSQLTVAPRPCGQGTFTPTGPIIPVGQFIVPAIIKPLVNSCQHFPSCKPSSPCPPFPPCPSLPPLQPQPQPPCPPTPPSPLPQPCIPTKPAPCIEDDDDEDLDKILYLLINNILENRKNSGKKSGSSKGTDTEKSIDTTNNFMDCGDDYEYILPTQYSPYQAPASSTFYPYGAGAGEHAPLGGASGAGGSGGSGGAGDAGFSLPVCGNGYAPEICLTFRPFPENC